MPDEFVPKRNQKIDEVFGFDSTSSKIQQHMSYLVHLRYKVYDRKQDLTQGKSYQKGYWFPLNKFLEEEDRPELKAIASKFYK